MTFTNEQLQAITSRSDQILVSAAAGSGKTAVLVQRILTLIEEGVDIDRLLIVTFTEAAAAEMKERISESITKRLENEPDNESYNANYNESYNEILQRQLSRLPAASISTIHAFCLRLVRDHFQKIDIDPSFRIGDNLELNLLQSQVMESLFEESYNNDPTFAPLVDAFGGGKTRDIRLDKLIRRLVDFIESRPNPDRAVSDYLNMDFSDYLAIVKEGLTEILDAALSDLHRACELCELPDGPEKYLLTFQTDIQYLQQLNSKIKASDKDLSDLDEIYNSFKNISFERIYTYRGKEKEATDEDLRTQAKDLRDNVKKQIERIKERYLFASPSKMVQDFRRLQPVTENLFNLALTYRKNYLAEKRARNLVDFNDLEHYAIQILRDDGKDDGKDENESEASVSKTANATATARALSAKYEEVLIDEYQDINDKQELILSAINPKRRFMVGDIKQSIYGFRHARPNLFSQKLADPDVESIILSKNFRSRIEVLNAVNFFFYKLMPGYDDKSALYYGANYTNTPDGSRDFNAELHVGIVDDKNQNIIQTEAQIIAQRIRQMKGVKHGDIVVLTRSMRSSASALTEELKLLGINAASESTGGFFDTPEIMVSLSLLKIVDNPRQDIDLLAVLRYFGFTADELLEIKLYSNENDFYDCLLSYENDLYDCPLSYEKNEGTLSKRIKAFLDNLANWRKKAVVLPISRLLGLLYEENKLRLTFGKMGGGTVRLANLQLLLEKAIKYESTSFSGLFHFVRYIEWLKNNDDESTAVILPEDANLVRVMTIHKSKGLEFPIVFVSMLGRKFNKMDERAGVILHPDYGMGAMYTDLVLRTRSNTISRVALSILQSKESTLEEQRILYVAMTRAKEKLILTGCTTGIADFDKSSALGGRIPSGSSYLEWLIPQAQQLQDNITLHIHHEISANLEKHPAPKAEYPANTEEHPSPGAAGPANIADIQIEKIPAEASFPSKLAISELKRIYAPETTPDSTPYEFPTLYEYAEDTFEAPSFYRASAVTPMQMGTILHTIVEHINLHQDRTETKIKKLITHLTKQGLLSQEEAESVNIQKILDFITSPLAERMRKSRHLYREIPFVVGIPANEIYSGSSDRIILVHGIIDCYFETQKGDIVLVDFKSGAKADLQRRYAVQMKIYKRALEQATGKPVSESLFYSL